MAWVAWVGILAWVAWVHYILARVKKKKRGSKFWDGSQVFYEKNILKNFAKFTAKTSVQESVVR